MDQNNPRSFGIRIARAICALLEEHPPQSRIELFALLYPDRYEKSGANNSKKSGYPATIETLEKIPETVSKFLAGKINPADEVPPELKSRLEDLKGSKKLQEKLRDNRRALLDHRSPPGHIPPPRSKTAVPKNPALGSYCPDGLPHYWVLNSPQGPVSQGRCRLCGAKRDFVNFPKDSNEPLVSKRTAF